jgi:hypothetical protein
LGGAAISCRFFCDARNLNARNVDIGSNDPGRSRGGTVYRSGTRARPDRSGTCGFDANAAHFTSTHRDA